MYTNTQCRWLTIAYKITVNYSLTAVTAASLLLLFYGEMYIYHTTYIRKGHQRRGCERRLNHRGLRLYQLEFILTALQYISLKYLRGSHARGLFKVVPAAAVGFCLH